MNDTNPTRHAPSATPTTSLVAGQQFTATTTGIRYGKRVYSTRTFVASRDQTVEQFIRNKPAPDQDRVFVQSDFGSVPELVITGSITVVHT